jgi:hypothetical protein
MPYFGIVMCYFCKKLNKKGFYYASKKEKRHDSEFVISLYADGIF